MAQGDHRSIQGEAFSFPLVAVSPLRLKLTLREASRETVPPVDLNAVHAVIYVLSILLTLGRRAL